MSVSSARLPCVIGGGVLWSGGGARGGDRGKNREIKEHNNTFLIIYHVPLCDGSSRGPKQNNNKSGWCVCGGGQGGGTTQCARFVFATPARCLRRQVRSGGKIKNETGLSVSPNRFYIRHSNGSRKTKIIMRADGNNENLRVEKHGIIVFVTAKEHVLMALIYE